MTNMKNLKFQNLKKTYIIAEAGLNHNGSIDIAKQLIDVAALSGVDAVKFQKRTVDDLATKETLDKLDDRFPSFGNTYREIREFLEFNSDQYRELKNYTEIKGLDFMVTAFDINAVDFLEEIDVQCYKLASHSLTNIELLKYISSINKPIILSTGMSNFDEIETALNIFKTAKTEIAIMHCISSYPTPINQCNLSLINTLIQKFDITVGYSGHELGYLPTLVAVSRGAKIIERHFTLNKNMVGFDHKISLEPDELINMVRDIRLVEESIGNGQKNISETEWITRNKYHVSMTSLIDIPIGSILTYDMVTYKNPGTGIPHKRSGEIIGKKANCNILANQLLTLEMFS
jgi:sialic acid synthase SpsE